MLIYKVTLNYNREVHTSYHTTKSPRQALSFATERLARQLGVTHKSVLNAFLANDQQYDVEQCKRKEDRRHDKVSRPIAS